MISLATSYLSTVSVKTPAEQFLSPQGSSSANFQGRWEPFRAEQGCTLNGPHSRWFRILLRDWPPRLEMHQSSISYLARGSAPRDCRARIKPGVQSCNKITVYNVNSPPYNDKEKQGAVTMFSWVNHHFPPWHKVTRRIAAINLFEQSSSPRWPESTVKRRMSTIDLYWFIYYSGLLPSSSCQEVKKVMPTRDF